MIIGIVGKANVGKSTFFKALTLANVLIANYPFATIEPNRGCAYVRVECSDKDFGVQCNPRYGICSRGTRYVPVEVIDVAGLVPGAHEGKGMGNQFLDDLRQADALIHVVDMAGTTNEKGESITPGTYDPSFDIKFLAFEIDMWYLSVIKKGWDKLARQIQLEHKAATPILAKQLSGLNVNEAMVESVLKKLGLDPELPISWTEDHLMQMAVELRKRTKPMIIAANKMDLPSAAANLEKAKKDFPDYMIIPCSAESELALKEAAKKGVIDYLPGDKDFKILKELSEPQKKALTYIQGIMQKYNGTGVQQIIDSAVYDLVKYMAIFPGGVNKLADKDGNIMPDCFLLPSGCTALDFAAKIHTDLARQFIRAIDVKTKRTVGKDHVLKHRDVVEIIT